MGRACNTHGGDTKCILGFGGKAKGNRPLGRSKSRWEDNIKTDLTYTGYVVWTGFI
jgi:hypothetical protein